MRAEDDARTQLRSATQDCHQRVDQVYSTSVLSDRESYSRFLSAQAAAFLPVEAALENAGVEHVLPDWSTRERSSLLRADLADLAIEPSNGSDLPIFDDEASILGAIYVLEGSRLGGTLLKRSVPADFPARFLGGVDSAAWRSLLGLLDERLDTPSKREKAVTAAREVFRIFEESGKRYLIV